MIAKLRPLILIATLLTVSMVGTSQTLEERSITQAANYLAIQDLPKAYGSISFALKLYDAGTVPEDLARLGESIYYAYLQDRLQASDDGLVSAMELELKALPDIYSDRIQSLLNPGPTAGTGPAITATGAINAAREAQELAAEIQRQLLEQESELRLEELRQEQELNDQLIELKRMELESIGRRDEILVAEIESRAEIAQIEREQQREFNETLLQTLTQRGDSGEMSTIMVIGLVGLGVIVVVGFVMLGIAIVRNGQQQQQMFQYTLEQNRATAREVVSLPIYEATQLENRTGISHEPDRKLLPSSTVDIDRFKALLARCREISSDIDSFTHRKNATRNVAELVYKVSTYLGYDEHDSMVFFAVGMVYDIGFLEMDEELFRAEKLTEDQFDSLREHTALGERRIGFVPNEYRPIFKAGIGKHHENLDGTGYPEGVSGEEIPYIARVIRAAESFIAMTSQREFREIKNKTDAITALMQDTDKYDPDVLYAIASVV